MRGVSGTGPYTRTFNVNADLVWAVTPQVMPLGSDGTP